MPFHSELCALNIFSVLTYSIHLTFASTVSGEAMKLLWVEIKRKGNSAIVAVTEGLLLGVSVDYIILQTRENAGSQATAQSSTIRLHVDLLHNSILHQHGISEI